MRNTTKISKFLSLILRHRPEKIGLKLDDSGWANVRELIKKANNLNNLDMETLEFIVENNNKKRFEFNDDKTKIRARQGHSVKVDLGYEAQEPPEYLYHGTATRFLDSIMDDGLKPMNRHHVHLSGDLDTASAVGKRHGKLIILKVKAQQMVKALGSKFYLTDNGVWLTDHVAPEYLEL